jgi:hypothetical protein
MDERGRFGRSIVARTDGLGRRRSRGCLDCSFSQSAQAPPHPHVRSERRIRHPHHLFGHAVGIPLVGVVRLADRQLPLDHSRGWSMNRNPTEVVCKAR